MLPPWIVILGLSLVVVALPLWYATMHPAVRTPLLLGHVAVLQVIPGVLLAPYAFRLPGGVLLTPANIIVSGVFMAAVLLVIVERKAPIVRLVVLTVLLAGVFELGLVASTSWVLGAGAVEPLVAIDPASYASLTRVLLVGTPLVVGELLLFVLVTEQLRSVIAGRRRAAVVTVGVFAAILVLDGVLFSLATGLVEPGLATRIAGGVVRKLVLAVALGLPLLAFVLVRREDLDIGDGTPQLLLRDVLLAPRRELVARLERREQERIGLLERTVHVAEEERRRLAGDLHDDAIQALTAADIRLQRVAASSPDLDLEAIRSLLRSGVGSLRRLILELRSPEVTAVTFEPLVRSYVARLLPEGTWDLTLEADLPSDVGEDVAAAAYRIVLEAVANAAKHAAAEHVAIHVETVDGRLVGEVVDDGIGIPHDAETGPGHLGLRAMRERADALGGRVEVHAVDGGTTVAFELPLGRRTADQGVSPGRRS